MIKYFRIDVLLECLADIDGSTFATTCGQWRVKVKAKRSWCDERRLQMLCDILEIYRFLRKNFDPCFEKPMTCDHHRRFFPAILVIYLSLFLF